jgi:hypothetical protein
MPKMAKEKEDEVEAIVGKKMSRGKVKYEVKWRGHTR